MLVAVASEDRVDNHRKQSPSIADGWAGAENLKSKKLMDGKIDGWTDKASYRVACPQLKTEIYPVFKSNCNQQKLYCVKTVHIQKF